MSIGTWEEISMERNERGYTTMIDEYIVGKVGVNIHCICNVLSENESSDIKLLFCHHILSN